MDAYIHIHIHIHIYIYYVFCLLTVQPVSAKLHLHSCSSCGFLIFFSFCLISLVFDVSLLQIKTKHESTYSASNLNTKCKSKLESFVKHCLFDFAPWQDQSKRPSCHFSSNNSRKTKTATAPLAATIVQYHGPQQKIQRNMSNMLVIAKLQSHLKPSSDGFG